MGILHSLQRFILGIALIACIVILCFNISLRLIGSSTTWAEEVIRFTMVWITFIALSIGFSRGTHYGIDVIQRIPSISFKKCVVLFTYLCAIVFSVFLVYYGAKYTLLTIKSGQISTALELPMWIVYLAVPLGGAMNILELLVLIVKKLKNWNKGE